MKNLYFLDGEEKDRILNLHESATKRQYLSEQGLELGQPTQPIAGPQNLQDTSGTIIKQGSGKDPYVYAKFGNDYYYGKLSDGDNPNWILATKQSAINAIKSKIFNEKIPVAKTITPPTKKRTTSQQVKTTDKVPVKKTKLGSEKVGGAKILKSLKNKGFTVDVKAGFEPNKGYFVSACKEHGCAEFTNNMLNTSLGDAWQAYSKVNAEINVSPSLVQQMTNLFNKMNKSGSIPEIEKITPFDSEAKSIIQQLIPNQSKFKNLPIGTVVGLYFPGSANYDLAFFQSAIGKSRDDKGGLHDVIAKPYFCKNPNNCSSTTWSENDLSKNVKFYPGNTLSSGKSFSPNTHLGFIGYIDSKGTPYVVHSVHQKVFAYPVTKLGGDGLSIVWSGNAVS